MREVIGLICETIAAPQVWDDVLARMAEGLGASAALFFKMDGGVDRTASGRRVRHRRRGRVIHANGPARAIVDERDG